MAINFAKTGTLTVGQTADTGIQNISSWVIAETAGVPAAATVEIRSGSGTGPVVWVIECESNGDDKMDFTDKVDAHETHLLAGQADIATGVRWFIKAAVGEVRWTVTGR